MPAGRLIVPDLATLEAIGTGLKSDAEVLRTQLEAIRVRADPAGIWESGAADRYQDEFTQWTAAQTTLIDSLQAMGSIIISYKQQLDEIERSTMTT